MYYICVVLDLYARKVIAYKISRHNSTQLTKSTVKAAYGTRKPTESLLFHSDQGGNYTSSEFRKYLKSLNIIQSFSNPGIPYDNSVMESFFGSFKREALYRYRFKTEKDFFEGVATYTIWHSSNRLQLPHANFLYIRICSPVRRNRMRCKESIREQIYNSSFVNSRAFSELYLL